MLYDPRNPLQQQAARIALERLIRRGRPFIIKGKDFARSLPQNSYLHLLIAYFGSQTGNDAQYVKENYYKRECNAELFVRTKQDTITGKVVETLRSSAELSEREMSLSIDRFRIWSARVAGIYLPEAHKAEEIAAMQIEVERCRQYL